MVNILGVKLESVDRNEQLLQRESQRDHQANQAGAENILSDLCQPGKQEKHAQCTGKKGQHAEDLHVADNEDAMAQVVELPLDLWVGFSLVTRIQLAGQ